MCLTVPRPGPDVCPSEVCNEMVDRSVYAPPPPGCPACRRSWNLRLEPLEHAVERTLGDELLGELVAPRSDLAADHAVVAEAVLADPVEARQ